MLIIVEPQAIPPIYKPPTLFHSPTKGYGFFDIIKMTKLKKKSMAITVIKPRCTIVSSQFVKQICTFKKLNDAVRRTFTAHWIPGSLDPRLIGSPSSLVSPRKQFSLSQAHGQEMIKLTRGQAMVKLKLKAGIPLSKKEPPLDLAAPAPLPR